MGRADLQKTRAYYVGLLPKIDYFATLNEPYADTSGEEVAYRRKIGERYMETLCARNELNKLIADMLQIIQRKEPHILSSAASAFETFNGIERYGRVHSFKELDKLMARIEDARLVILNCTHRITNYAGFKSE
jgi:hypothetical protein